MSPFVTAASGAVLPAIGYAVGRARPGPRLLNWAEDAVVPGWRHPMFWPAVPVVLLALAWAWTVHPRRTLENVRSWRAEHHLEPAPVMDPNWKNRR